MNWLTKIFSATSVLVASELNQLRDNFAILDQHTHTGAAGDGAAFVSSAASEDAEADEFPLFLFLPHVSAGAFSILDEGGIYFSAVNDSATYRVGLRAGVYRVFIPAKKNNDCGILTVTLNSNDVGTVNFYDVIGGGGSYSIDSTLIFTVATAGWFDIKFTVTGKHASSTNYFCRIPYPINFLKVG